MVAVVELPRHRARRVERPERQHFDAGLTHRLEEGRRRRHAADRVVDHAHFDARLAAADQQFAQCAPDVVVRKDVGFEMHVMLRILDGAANRSQRLRAVHQQRDAIAGDERRVCALAECIDQSRVRARSRDDRRAAARLRVRSHAASALLAPVTTGALTRSVGCDRKDSAAGDAHEAQTKEDQQGR